MFEVTPTTRCAITVLAALALTLPSSAASYELTPTQDARILGLPGFESANFRDDILSVYASAANVQRTLLEFDLSPVELAPTERVGSATLRLQASVSFGGSGGKPMEVYALKRPWTEAGVTWLRATAATPWSTAGGDFAGVGGNADGWPFAANPASVNQDGPVTWDLRELVDQWLEGVRPNHGLLLKSSEGNGLTFIQRESASIALRPGLTIITEPGPPRLRVEREPGAGHVGLSWRGVGTATLQERAALTPGSDWADSALPVTDVAGRSVVTLTPSASERWYRLRSN